MLTDEEREQLELDKANAKVRCREVWNTICELERFLSSFKKDHDCWRRKFEKADRLLADENKIILPSAGHKMRKTLPVDDVSLLVKLDRSQILRIAEELGIGVEVDEEDD